jgi:hypothetical protein
MASFGASGSGLLTLLLHGPLDCRRSCLSSNTSGGGRRRRCAARSLGLGWLHALPRARAAALPQRSGAPRARPHLNARRPAPRPAPCSGAAAGAAGACGACALGAGGLGAAGGGRIRAGAREFNLPRVCRFEWVGLWDGGRARAGRRPCVWPRTAAAESPRLAVAGLTPPAPSAPRPPALVVGLLALLRPEQVAESWICSW